MTGASATSPVEVDPDVDPPPEGADDSLALLSARCIAECERRERRIASRGTHTLAGRIIYDYSSPPPTRTYPVDAHPRIPTISYPRAV
jgi:hypothetical protein